MEKQLYLVEFQVVKQLCCLEAPAKQLVFSKMGHSRKITKGGGTWNFQGYWLKKQFQCITPPQKRKWNFQGPWKFLAGMFKIEQLQVEFPLVLIFDLGISKGVTQFCRVSRSESLFSPEFLCNDLMIHHDIMIVYK